MVWLTGLNRFRKLPSKGIRHHASHADRCGTHDWKAVQVDVRKNRNGPVEIYDLKSDLGEERDRSAEQPEQAARAKKLFEQAHKDGEGFKWDAPIEKPARKQAH